jgi:hypothetical protein
VSPVMAEQFDLTPNERAPVSSYRESTLVTLAPSRLGWMKVWASLRPGFGPLAVSNTTLPIFPRDLNSISFVVSS